MRVNPKRLACEARPKSYPGSAAGGQSILFKLRNLIPFNRRLLRPILLSRTFRFRTTTTMSRLSETNLAAGFFAFRHSRFAVKIDRQGRDFVPGL